MTSSVPLGTHAISLQQVKRTFDPKGGCQPVHALRGVTLSVAKGSMIAIKGESGSGKTTLLQIIGALDAPTWGTVVVNGKDLAKMTDAELTQYRANTIGFVFQSFNLIPNLSAVENVELALEAKNTPVMEQRARASSLLNLVGMGDRLNHRPAKLSGGEQQRVAIARALANDPPIILADEPTGNLDTKSSKVLVKLLRRLNRENGRTMLIVTHSEEMARACDYVVTIKDGVAYSRLREEMEEEEKNLRKTMREILQISGKVLSKLFDADYCSFSTIADADEKELGWVLSDQGLARRLIAASKKACEAAPQEEVPDNDEDAESPGQVNLSELLEKLGTGITLPVECESCGATFAVSKDAKAEGLRFCSYCGSRISEDRLANLLTKALE
jgi:ABC-type lipoprotein export system ATPase subunit